MYGQKEADPTIESLQGELKALRDEVMWLRSQLAMRAMVYAPTPVPSPNPWGNPNISPPMYYSGGNF